MNILIYGMIYLGSALMVYNIYSYNRYTKKVQEKESWGKERWLLYIPVFLLTFFLLGYLGIGLFGNPDLLVSGILFGGSVFVFIVFRLLSLITERVKEGERLEARAMAAEESSKAKTDFLSGISHEMRTPLNAIIGLDTIALRNPAILDETRIQLEGIGSNARHLRVLIDNILDISSIESGRLSLIEEQFSMKHTIEELEKIADARCGQKQLEFISEISPETDVTVAGDREKLEKILFNLLDNAVKYTSAPGSVTFKAELLKAGESSAQGQFTGQSAGQGHFAGQSANDPSQSTAGGSDDRAAAKTGSASDSEPAQYVFRFTVSDTGVGIEKDFLPHLFELFSREDYSSTSRYGGSGLGLAFVKRLTDLMGGEIHAESEKGAGSTFSVILPFASALPGSRNAETERKKKEAAAASDGSVQSMDASAEIPLYEDVSDAGISGKRVLVVDDIDINAEIVADLLDLEGVISERAENGQIAVDMFAASPVGYYDAVLMDLRMPVMDGFEASRTIRGLDRPDAKSITIIALTANAMEEDRRHASESGMNAFMPKPLDADRMYDMIGGAGSKSS